MENDDIRNRDPQHVSQQRTTATVEEDQISYTEGSDTEAVTTMQVHVPQEQQRTTMTEHGAIGDNGLMTDEVPDATSAEHNDAANILMQIAPGASELDLSLELSADEAELEVEPI